MKLVNFDRINLISLAFLLLFIAFNSAANFSTKAMQDDGFDNLGFYSMATLYFFFSFCSFFSTAIVNRLGIKPSLVLGAFCYFFWVFSFLCPAFYGENRDSSLFLLSRGFIYFIVLFSSAVNGFGAGILWVAQGKYIADCASDDNRGFFYSYSWAIFMCSQILGNLIAGLVVKNTS